ncbi:MAG: cereblon family protein [Myxococcales bacterium]|nr:cereblon family protein [Myxococcota bacterium]MDW8282299.1 cereblon family protein [Myxococcales bacterium]
MCCGTAGPFLSLLRSSGPEPKRAPDRAPIAQDEDAASVRRPICCRSCGAVIADAADLLHPVEGQGQVFFNPYGILHEVVTVRHTRGVLPRGPATTEFTWFAGYAWRHAHCARCDAHLGWHYEAVSSEATPPSFWGLRRSEIILDHPRGQDRLLGTTAGVAAMTPSWGRRL